MTNKRFDFFSDPTWPIELPESPLHVESLLPQEILQKNSSKSEHFRISENNTQQQHSPKNAPKKLPANESLDQVNNQQEQNLSIFENSSLIKVQIANKQLIKKENSLEQQNQENCLEQEDQSQEKISYQKSSNSPSLFTPHKKLKYNILDQEQKQFLVSQTRFLSIMTVAKMYGVAVNNIARWVRSCERKKGGGRKVYDPVLEEKLKSWILSQKSKDGGLSLSKNSIKEKAKLWANIPEFKASKGWLERFVTRNKDLQLEDILGIKIKSLNITNQTPLEETFSTPITQNGGKNRYSQRLKRRKDAIIKKIQQDE